PFAKFRFGDQQGAHATGRENQRLDGLASNGVTERTMAGELRQFAKERAWSERVEVLALAMGIVAINVDLSAEDETEANADFADRGQGLASGEPAHVTEAPSALDVCRIEERQDLVAARLDDRRAGNAHGGTCTRGR